MFAEVFKIVRETDRFQFKSITIYFLFSLLVTGASNISEILESIRDIQVVEVFFSEPFLLALIVFIVMYLLLFKPISLYSQNKYLKKYYQAVVNYEDEQLLVQGESEYSKKLNLRGKEFITSWIDYILFAYILLVIIIGNDPKGFIANHMYESIVLSSMLILPFWTRLFFDEDTIIYKIIDYLPKETTFKKKRSKSTKIELTGSIPNVPIDIQEKLKVENKVSFSFLNSSK